MTLELFAYWRTTAAYRVRVALALKGIKAAERFVDLDHGGQHDPAFLEINPMGAVPALRVGPGVPPLTQSLAILEYLEETNPLPPLLPADPLGRARVRSLSLMLAADTHPFIVLRVRKLLAERMGAGAAEWKAWQTHWLTTGLQAFERRLAGDAATGAFCHGAAVTFADIGLASLAVSARVLGIVVADTPNIDRIVARCEALPAFAGADPMRQEGAPR